MKTIPLLITLLVISTQSYSQSTINKEVDDLSADYAEYTAYLELIVDAVRNSGDESTASKYEEIKKEMMFYSLLLASEGRAQETALKVTNSRMDLYKKEMLKEIDGDRANIAILMNKHHQKVLDIYQNPPAILIEIVAKKAKEIDANQSVDTTPASAPR